MSVTNSWRTFFSDPARDSPDGVRFMKRGEELFLTRNGGRPMSSECYGPTARPRRRIPLLPQRDLEEPEDGDWERFCQECQD